MDKSVTNCIEDMRTIAETSRISLDAQLRAYDLLQSLTENMEMGVPPRHLQGALPVAFSLII